MHIFSRIDNSVNMTAKSEKTKLKVETKEGPIYGYKETTNEGTYCKFKGIPYAKPPVGHLRFLVS